jgi:hypothetical protein
MLRLPGSCKRLCDGLTRRDFLVLGSAGGLSLATRLRLQAAGATRPARADACILLFPYGSPRTSAGASGLGSKVSCCGGEP